MNGLGGPPQPEDDAEQERRLRLVGQLAGGIAHDFNNLLTAILGAADAILGRAETAEETVVDAQQIRRGVERGAALVRQLLAFSRQQTLQPRVVSVNAAIEDAAHLLRRLLGARIALLLELEQPGRRVKVDPGQLDQVLLNLAVNARDAMTEGGTLTLSSGHATLYRARLAGAETIPPGRYVTITVADSGVGISEAVMPRIFEPFFTTKRASRTGRRGGAGMGDSGSAGTGLVDTGSVDTGSVDSGSVDSEPGGAGDGGAGPGGSAPGGSAPGGSAPGGSAPGRPAPGGPVPGGNRLEGSGSGGGGSSGTGLGLSTVLGIVRQSGGFLEVTSQVGVGTRMVVYLPRHVAEEAEAASPYAPARAAQAGRGRVVLVVEDEAPVRLVLSRALTRAGWQVLAAESGESALEILETLGEMPESQPSVVISDVVMPGMDGPSLVRAVRRIRPGIPAVLVSGYAEPVLRQDLVSLDIAFLTKPYAAAELLDLIARLADTAERLALRAHDAAPR